MRYENITLKRLQCSNVIIGNTMASKAHML